MKILATDLDRTLLPNGSWESDSGAIELFNELGGVGGGGRVAIGHDGSFRRLCGRTTKGEPIP